MESRICQTLEVSPAEPKEFPTYLFGLDIDQYELVSDAFSQAALS